MQSTRNKLIQLLASSENKYISGQKLSDELQISRSAIWKHMRQLEKDGYAIEGKSNTGYRIVNQPNKVSENTIQWGLNAQWIGKRIIHKEIVPSTQIIAHEAAQTNAGHGTIVIANEQKEGRGRMGRGWHSAKQKGIWLSIILRPSMLPYLAPQLTLLTATALADAISSHTGASPKIKWPNDILINGKKVAGILTEMQAEQDQIQYVVIGVGLNVNQTDIDFPEEVKQVAASLLQETGKTWDIAALIQEILITFENAFDRYIAEGFPHVKDKWENYGFKIGETIQVKTTRDQFQATFLGLAEDGALLTKALNGEVKKLYSAEIDWFDEGER